MSKLRSQYKQDRKTPRKKQLDRKRKKRAFESHKRQKSRHEYNPPLLDEE